jgi:tetratricopeptide (TPR) repeat protein
MQKYIYVLMLFILCSGCKKFLDEKPDRSLMVPHTLQDCQAILDYYVKMNYLVPSSGETSADNYFVKEADFNTINPEYLKNMYLWKRDRLFETFPNDWSRCYDVVYYSNTVIDIIKKIEKNDSNNSTWNNIMGQALFSRAHAFWHTAITWANAYDEAAAAKDLGIPLRLDPDFNISSSRSSVIETYNRIIEDLQQSIQMLPAIPVHVMRPGKAAAYAMLARTYLSMRKYDKAGLYADSSLQVYNKLIDYNTLNPSATFPVPELNSEIIYQQETGVPATLMNNRSRVDSLLYASYDNNDLRKVVFFKKNTDNTYGFKGSYDGQDNLFSGIAVDEVYLMRAECNARAGKTKEAMNDLNTLLIKRWKSGTFKPLDSNTAEEALKKVLEERRKELLYRMLRWMDLKRLNKEQQFQKSLKRILNNEEYTLLPNDPKYALPIPERVIELSGMQQNPG